jgi:hypothetical protein
MVNRPNWQLHALGVSHANSVTTNFKLHWHELGGQSWYDQNLALASSSLDLYRHGYASSKPFFTVQLQRLLLLAKGIQLRTNKVNKFGRRHTLIFCDLN